MNDSLNSRSPASYPSSDYKSTRLFPSLHSFSPALPIPALFAEGRVLVHQSRESEKAQSL